MFQHPRIRGQRLVTPAVVLVGHADLEDGQRVQHVELGHGPEIDAVDRAGVAAHDGIEPAAASGPPRGRPEFAAADPQRLAGCIRQLRREGTGADTRGVGLDHTHHPVDAARRQAGADAGAARRRVGGGDKGIGAEIDVEHRALGALQQDPLPRPVGRMHPRDGVRDEGGEFLRRRGVARDALADVERGGTERDQVAVHLLRTFGDPRGEVGRQEIAQPQAAAVHLVGIPGADAAPGGADLAAAVAPGLLCGIERAVVVHDGMRPVADKQPPAHVVALRLEGVDLLQQLQRIGDHAIADEARPAGMQNAGGDQVQHMLAAADDDGVAGVAAALVAHDQVGLRGQHVDDLAFAFIAPLGANENGGGHSLPSFAAARNPLPAASGPARPKE